ncbi:MAG TPA: serine hydrolase [Thermoanaerobaculia bacterium]|jgi:CubicO group peptidase (beta-lactamase class C family)/predicted aspartyl protease
MTSFAFALLLSIVTDLTSAIDQAAAQGKFSGVVLLAENGKPILTKAWGFADAAQKIPNKTDTKFNLGSINKIFTQVAIGQLAAAGKLSLDDTIRKHLPDYPSPIADKITIQQLIEHRSGMGDHFGPEYLAAPPSSLRKLSDYLPLFVKKPLEFEPGTEQRYSNAGYIVLGLIIERESGQTYYDYVRDHIFKPAGMKDTDSFPLDAKVANRAAAITKRGDAQLPGRGSSAGGGYSTAADLLRFAQALRSDQLLPKKWTDWVFRNNEKRSLGIAGGSPGINAVLLIGSPYTLAILSNFDPPAAEEIAKVARPLMGLPAMQQRRAAQSEPDEVLIRGPVDLPMTFAGHVPVIEAKINGKGPYRFAVDSGFGGSIAIGAALAQQLALPVVGEIMAGDPTGRNPRRVKMMRAESVDVATAHFGGVEVTESLSARDVDGIISLNLFRSLLVTFDYPKSRFQLRGGALPSDAMSYTVEHGVPAIEVDVNGQKFKADIDSGSPAELTLPKSVAKSLTLASEPVVVGRGMTADGPFEVYGAPLQGDVRVGAITLTNPRIDFVDVFRNANLGSRFLRNYVVTFDPRNKRLQMTKP